MGVFFNGRLWVSPATMSVVDDTQMYNRNLSVGNVLAIIGNASAGVKATTYRFGSAEEARSFFLEGSLVDAIGKAFDPSAQTYGPTTVIGIKVGDSAPSTLTLKDGAAANTITLTASSTGAIGNRIQVKIEDGTLIGKKLSTQLDTTVYSQDNVHRSLFSIQYTGSGSGATVTNDGATFTLFDGTNTVALDLTTHNTIKRLIVAIRTVPNWTVTAIAANGLAVDTSTIDIVTSAPAKASPYLVAAHFQAVIDWFNAPRREGFVTADFATSSSMELPANLPWTRMSGGTDNANPSGQEWQDCFDLLQLEDVQLVVPLSGSPSVHAMADTHCTFMSNIGRKERRAIVGPNLGTSDDDAVAAVQNINSDRTAYVHLGIYEFNSFGDPQPKLFPPYYTAAMIGGMFSGVDPGTALTNKAFKARGIERKLRNPTDTDVLINGGVLCIEQTNEGYKIVKSISTWLINDNFNRVEMSCGIALDFVSRNIRNALSVLIGERASPATMVRAEQICDSTLRELARPQPMGPEVIVGNADNPAWRNLVISIEGDVMRVEFECSPVIPVNYIPIVIHAVPFSGVLTQSGQ